MYLIYQLYTNKVGSNILNFVSPSSTFIMITNNWYYENEM